MFRNRANPELALLLAGLLLLVLPASASDHWTGVCSATPPEGLAAPAPRNTLVLIIDDLGHQWRNGMAMVELPGKINLAVLPHTPHAERLAQAGFAAGKEIMLHAPMSNVGGVPLGQGALTADMPREEFDRALADALDAVPLARGVNNHMGSELTQLPLQMGWLMQALLRRDLYFVDSRTSAETVAAETAAAYRVPNLSRTVFLDNERTPEAIGQHFDRLVRLAEQNTLAVGIGHPYPETAKFLREAIPALRCRGVELAYVSEVLEGKNRGRGPLLPVSSGPAGAHPAVNDYTPWSEPDFYAPLSHVGLGLGNGVLPEVKDGSSQHRIGPADGDALYQVVEGPHSP
jgi:polysaccharide deacetylase 2 family uncharacterized protein YibQ